MCLNFISTVEPQRVPVTNESFQSDLCVSPLVTSPAPYFTCTFENYITLNDAKINELYNASVSRNITSEGHHQALLTILDTNPTFNNAIITCWVNSAVILQYRLIIGKSPTFMIREMSDSISRLSSYITIMLHCRNKHGSYSRHWQEH